MEKLSLDNDSPIRGDFKRETDTLTPVRQAEKEENRDVGEVCDQGFLKFALSVLFYDLKKQNKGCPSTN